MDTPTPTPRTEAFVITAKKFGIEDCHAEAMLDYFGTMERELASATAQINHLNAMLSGVRPPVFQ